MKLDSPVRLAVVGAGVAGLAAATFLARDGYRVSVFERMAKLATDGTGILLQPAGIEVLRQLDIEERAFACGTSIDRVVALDGHATRMDLRYAQLRPGLHALGIRRPTLASLLLDAARDAGATLHAGVTIETLDERATEVLIIERSGTRHGPFDLALICDGQDSRLRQHVTGGRRIRVNALDRGVLTFIGALPVATSAHTLIQRLDGSRDAVGLLPVGRDGGENELTSFFWNVRAADLPALKTGGVAAWRATIAAFAPEAEVLLSQAAGFDALTWSTTSEVAMHRWARGRIAVLGDAAHAMNPLLGLGATMALLDAMSLSRCLSEWGAGPAALAAWDTERRRDVAPYVRVGRLWTRLDRAGLAGLRRSTFMAAARGPRVIRRRLLEVICGWRGRAVL